MKGGNNMLNLYLVTFEGDNTQFLVNAETEETDEELQNILYKNGLKTAKKRDWKNHEKKIISLYDD